jgi:hypothetical protein
MGAEPVSSLVRHRLATYASRGVVLLALVSCVACGSSPTAPSAATPSAPAPPPLATRTLLSFVSDPGDYIGQGETHEYGLQDGIWHAGFSTSNGVEHVFVSVSSLSGPATFWWDLDLAAPKGQPLSVGVYEAARRYPFQPDTQPGLDFSGSGRGCNGVTGRFTIEAITLGPANSLDRLQATFDQNCEGSSRALHGRIAVLANPWR